MAWIYQRGNVWWLGERVNGKPVFKSLETTDKKTAEQQLEKIRTATRLNRLGMLTDDLIRQLTGKQDAKGTFSLRAAVNQWNSENRSLSESTRERYEAVMTEFCDFVHATDAAPLLCQIQKETAGTFLRDKRAKTSAANAKLNRRVLSSFFGYCKENEMIDEIPLPSATALKLNGESGKVRRAFSLVELSTLYRVAPNKFWKYMILAGYYAGQRMGDLICLTWGNIDFEQDNLRLTQRKTGKVVTVPLHAALRACLLDLKADAGRIKGSDPLWPEQAARYDRHGAGSFSNEFYSECLVPAGLAVARNGSHHKKAEDQKLNGSRQVSEVSYHCLRHSFVSLLKLTGTSQAVAKELAGHSTDAVSDVYTHVDTASMTRAIGNLPQLTN